MSNSFSPSSMNFHPRPQVCHPSPPDTPEIDYPDQVKVTIDLTATPGITPIQIVDEETVAEGPTPGVYPLSGVDTNGNEWRAKATLALAPDDSGIIVDVDVDEEGTITTYTYTALLGTWDGSSQTTLGPEEWTGPGDPDGQGKIEIGAI